MQDRENGAQSSLRRTVTRDFVLGFLALVTFMAAAHSLTPTLPIYLKKLGSSEREIGALVGILGIASLVSRLFVGGALTRYAEKRVMIVGALLSAVAFLSYIALRPFWPFFAMRFFQGVAFACLDTAVLSVVVKATDQKYRGQVIGYLLLASPFSMAISAYFSVFISNRAGFSMLFLFGVALSLLALFFSMMLKGREVDIQQDSTSPRGLGLLDLKILVPAIVSFLVAFALSGLFAFIPLYALKCGIANPGLFFSAVAVVLFLSRILGGKAFVVYDKEMVILGSIVLLMAALVILSFSKTLPMFVLVGVLWGTGLAFVNPAAMAYSLEYSGSSGGPALGTYQMFMDSGLAVGAAISGLLIPQMGYRTTFLFLAFVCLVNIGYFHFYVRKRKPTA